MDSTNETLRTLSMEILDEGNRQDELSSVVVTTQTETAMDEEELIAHEGIEVTAVTSGIGEQTWDEGDQPSDEEPIPEPAEQAGALAVDTSVPQGGQVPALDSSAPSRIDSAINMAEIDWDNLLLTSTNSNQSTSREPLPRSFSFDHLPDSKNTNTTTGSIPRHRRGASLTPASSQTPANHNETTTFIRNTSSPVTPYSVESSVNLPDSSSPVAETMEGVGVDEEDVNQTLLNALADLPVLTTGVSASHQVGVLNDSDAVTSIDQVDAEPMVQAQEETPSSPRPQTVPLPEEQVSDNIGTLAVSEPPADVDVDLDAELARLEEEFLSELGVSVDSSKIIADDAPMSFSDLNVLDDLEQHKEKTTSVDTSIELDKARTDAMVGVTTQNIGDTSVGTSGISTAEIQHSFPGIVVDGVAMLPADIIVAPSQETKTSGADTVPPVTETHNSPRSEALLSLSNDDSFVDAEVFSGSEMQRDTENQENAVNGDISAGGAASESAEAKAEIQLDSSEDAEFVDRPLSTQSELNSSEMEATQAPSLTEKSSPDGQESADLDSMERETKLSGEVVRGEGNRDPPTTAPSEEYGQSSNDDTGGTAMKADSNYQDEANHLHLGMSPIVKHYGILESLEGSVGVTSPSRLPVVGIDSLSANDPEQTPLMSNTGTAEHRPVSSQNEVHRSAHGNPLLLEMTGDSDLQVGRIPNQASSSVDSGMDDFVSAVGDSFDIQSLRENSDHTDKSIPGGLNTSIGQSELPHLGNEGREISDPVSESFNLTEIDAGVVEAVSPMAATLHIPELLYSSPCEEEATEESPSRNEGAHVAAGSRPTNIGETTVGQQAGDAINNEIGKLSASKVELADGHSVWSNADADAALHEAMAFLHDYETNARSETTSKGGASTPMSDFQSATGSLDDILVGELDVTRGSWMDDSAEGGQLQQNNPSESSSMADDAGGLSTDKAGSTARHLSFHGSDSDPLVDTWHDTIENSFEVPNPAEGVDAGREKVDAINLVQEKRPENSGNTRDGRNNNYGTLQEGESFTSLSWNDDLPSSSIGTSDRLQHQDLSNSVDEDSQMERPLHKSVEEAILESVRDIRDGKSHGDIFRPQYLDKDGDSRRRIDFSAVSSVTSASSPSTVKAFQATGVISPIRVDESRSKIRSGYEQNARPPLFPRGMDSHHQPHSTAIDDSSSGLDRPSLSKFLKRTNEPSATYLQADESIFALMDDSSGSASDSKSTEGPVDESSGDDMGSTELSHHEYEESEGDTGAALWNMLSRGSPSQLIEDARRPDFVLMPLDQGLESLGVESAAASPMTSAFSDLGSQLTVRKSRMKRPQRTGSFKYKLEEAMERSKYAKGFPVDEGYSDSSFAGGSLGREIMRETRAQPMRSYSSPDLRVLENTPADILKQLDAGSPLPLATKPSPISRSFSEDLVSGVSQAIGQEESDFASDEIYLEAALKDFAALPEVTVSLSSELIVNDKAAAVASVRWRQLVAQWSHQQVFDMSCRRSTSLDPVPRLAEMRGGESTGGKAITWNNPFAIELQGLPLRRDKLAGNYDAIPPLNREHSFPGITRFLSSMFGVADTSGITSPPVQQPSVTGKKQTIEELAHTGSEFKESLAALLEHLAGFAVETDFGYLPFSVSLKDSTAAVTKATSKYRGNTHKILDLLRGRIIFPDEGSLVCALVKLFQLKGTFTYSSDSHDVEKSVKFQVVRIKNLFQSESGCMLPTGYRHLLLNILLDDAFIVELQFNILSLFAVLGENGPKLHVELRKLQDGTVQDLGDDLLVRCIQGGPSIDATELTSYLVKSHTNLLPKPDETPPLDESLTAEGTEKNDLEGSALAESPDATDPEGDPPEPGGTSALPFDHTEVANQMEVADVSDGDLSPPSHLDSPPQAIPVLEDAVTPKAGRKVQRLSTIKTELFSLTIGLTLANVWKCLLRQAVQEIKSKPRDLACLHCLLLILDFILDVDYNDTPKGWHAASGLQIPSNKGAVLALKEQLLQRALIVGYHDFSAGMIGWVATLEHDETTWFKGEHSLEVLQTLGACLAEQGKWLKARDVFQTLVLRCERYLTLQHPMTIACMLDLAVSATATSQEDLVGKTLRIVTDRMAAYLAEMEHCATLHYQQSISQSKSGFVAFSIDAGRHALSMLEAFLSQFEVLSRRKLMTLVPRNHEILLAQQCIAADCAVVIANCRSLVELSGTAKCSTKYWQYAFELFVKIFKEGSEKYGVDDPRIASAAYGCARCLRGMGKVPEAINVLTPVAKAISGNLQGLPSTVPQTFTFIPQPVFCAETVDRRIVAAQCQCLLAVLTADNQPNDDGRKKALKCLQKASVVLRHTLDHTAKEDPRRKQSMLLLHQIEEEARRIFHPLGGTEHSRRG